jgi:hypothetical protein
MSTGLALQRRRLAATPPCRLAASGAALVAASHWSPWLAAAAEFIAMATAECTESCPIDIELGAAEGSCASASRDASSDILLKNISGALENWYDAQFRRIVWCGNAVALSVGPTITNYELRGGPTMRGRILQCAHALTEAAERAIGYATRAPAERAALLAAVAAQAGAAYEYTAELTRQRSLFCDVARAEPGGTADCAVAVTPVLLLHLRSAIQFLADELSASITRIANDEQIAEFNAAFAALRPSRKRKK